jgi:hypothetical protein
VLQEAAHVTQCRYPVDYTPGYAALLPHLGNLSKCATLEMCRGILQEQKGETQQAIATIDTIMRMAGSLDAEPDLISVLVQNKIYYRGSDALGWLLNHRHLTREQLTELEQIFGITQPTNRLELALVGERCCTLALFHSSAAEILNVIDPLYDKRAQGVLNLRFLRLSGTLKKDEIRFLDEMSACEAMVSEPVPYALKDAEIRRRGLQTEARKGAILTAMFVPGMFKGIERNAERHAQQRVINVVLSIERYRNVKGRLPDSVGELIPEFLPEIPTDPFDEEQLRYRKDGESYFVYSVGPDCVDDDGKKQIPRAAKIDQPKGDIVFAVFR